MTALVCTLLLSVPGCKKSDIGFNYEPFFQLARNASCADIRSRLFVIDDNLILFDREGSCADNSYQVVLYKDNIDTIVCEYHDSIMGPVKNVYDNNYRILFETIIDNLDKSNLGLGSNHFVRELSF